MVKIASRSKVKGQSRIENLKQHSEQMKRKKKTQLKILSSTKSKLGVLSSNVK